MKHILLLLTTLLWAGTAYGESSLRPCSPSFIFQEDFDNCFGEIAYTDGARYFGEFKEGKKHGQGTLIYPNGVSAKQ